MKYTWDANKAPEDGRITDVQVMNAGSGNRWQYIAGLSIEHLCAITMVPLHELEVHMKSALIIAAASASLLAGSAWAGGNCQYGHGAVQANADADKLPLMASELTEEERLALLKKKKLEKQDVPGLVIHN